MKKRILAILLTLVMLIGLLPVTAWAENTDALPVETVEEQLSDVSELLEQPEEKIGEEEPEPVEQIEEEPTEPVEQVEPESAMLLSSPLLLGTDFTGWTQLTDGGTLSGGNYYLNTDVTLTNNIIVNGTVTIDLNGHVLKGTGQSSVIIVSSGENLTLQDSNSTAAHSSAYASLPAGGCITGGTGNVGDDGRRGGGVLVLGTFTMEGGNIVGNTATYGGGGVFVNANATFNMKGGTIADNNANCIKANNTGGGGVFVLNANTSKFNMSGGKITGNTATNGRGGGVFAGSWSVMTMSGGEIAYNYADDTNANEQGGGGVMTNGSFTMTGGSIHHNTAKSGEGGGVYSYQTDRGPRVLGGSAKITGNVKGGTISKSGNGYTITGGSDSNLFVAKNGTAYTLITLGDGTEGKPIPTADMKIGVAMTGSTGQFTNTTATSTEYLKCFTPDNNSLTVYRRGDNTLWLLTDWGALGNELAATTPKTMQKLVENTLTSPFTVADASGSAPAKITLSQNFKAVSGDKTLAVSGTKTLDLKGYTLDADKQTSVGSVITVNNSATLTLEDGSQAKTGTITGGKATNGGGVFLSANATNNTKVNFYMNGGKIIGNEATGRGGGVFAGSWANMVMTDGEISYNSASGNASGADNGGGGVMTNGAFTMTGGSIHHNTIAAQAGSYAGMGGGVYRCRANDTRGNTTVLGGTAQITDNVVGGTITKNGNTYTLNGGTVSNLYIDKTLDDDDSQKFVTLSTATAPKSGMNVGVTLSTSTGKFTNTAAATDTAYFFSDDPVYADQFVTNHLELVKSWTALQNALSAATPATVPGLFEVNDGTIKLLADFKAATGDTTLEVKGTKTLDLNGHVINGKIGDSASVGSVITVGTGANLTVEDDGSTEHYFTVGADGLWTLTDTKTETTKTVTGGVITGGTGWRTDTGGTNGGGVYVGDGTFTMNGGNIVGNSVTPNDKGWDGSGGGVGVNEGNSTFTMNGGTISGNYAGNNGGGVGCCGNDAGGYGTFNMKDGRICDNVANCGGGIQNNYGNMNLCAAAEGTIEITGNRALSAEGGAANWGEMHLSGKVIIKDNVCGKKYYGVNYPLNLATCNPITIDGALTGSEIYITHASDENDTHTTGVLTSGFTTQNPGAKLGDFFTYDGPDTFAMILNSSNELEVVNTYAITNGAPESGKDTANGYLTVDKAKEAAGNSVTITVIPSTGYALTADSLKAIYTDGAEKTCTLIPGEGNTYTFTMPAFAVTVTAEFEKIPKTSVTITATPDGFTYGETGKIGYKDVSAKVDSQEVSGLAATLVATYYKETATAGHYETTGSAEIPTHAGNYKVVLSVPEANENYTGSKEVTFTIAKANGAATPPTAKNNLVYTGQDQELVTGGSSTTGTVKYAVTKNTETTAPTGGWGNTIPKDKDADTYRVWYKSVGDSNHNDTDAAYVDVTIAKAPLTVTAKDKSITYGNAAANNGVEYKGFVNGEGESVLGGTLSYDYGSYTTTSPVGTYDIIPSGLTSDNYEITFIKGALTVAKEKIAKPTAAEETYTYNGNEQSFKFVDGTFDANTMNIEGNKQTNANETGYTVTVTPKANYAWSTEGDCTFTWKIGKANYVMSGVTFNNVSNTYDGSAHHPVISGTLPTGADGVQVTVSYSEGQTDVGEKEVTATFATTSTNYNTPTAKTAKQTITAAEITNISIAQTGTLTYNGQSQTAGVSASADTVNSQTGTFQYSTTNESGYADAVPAFTDAGEHTVYYKVTAPNHEDATGSFKVTIDKKNIATATVTLGNSLTYTGTEQTQSIASVTVDGLTVTYEVTNATATNADSYTLTVTGTGNFTGSTTKAFTIAKANGSVTAPTANELTYNGQDQELVTGGSSTTGTIQYKLGTDGGYSTGIPTAKAAGDYTVYYKVVGDSNHENVEEGSVSVTIAPKPITVSGITASDKTYDGGTTATLVYTGADFSGLVDGEELAVTATGTFANANVGTDKTVSITGITLSDVTGKDYLKNYVLAESGNQTQTTANITKKDVTVTITPNGGTYAGTITGAVAQFSGLVSGESFEPVLTYTGADYNNKAVPTNAGTYTVTATLPSGASNYNLTGTVTAEFVINKAAGSVTAPTANELTYNGQDQELVTGGSSTTGTVKYAVTGNTMTTAPTGDWYDTIPTGKDAGTYRVWYKVTGDNNHNDVAATYTDVTIAQKEVGLTWSTLTDAELVYDGNAKVLTATATELGTGDVCGVNVAVSTGKDNVNVGTFTFTAKGLTNSNYKLPASDTSIEYTITPKPVSLTVSNDRQRYDGKEKFVTVTASPGDFNAFTVIYKNSKGETVASPTDVGSYDVYASLTSLNYRFADSADGAARKLGTLTIYRTSSGSYTPGHTVTSDLKNVTKVTVDGKVVDSRYYTVNGGTVVLSGEFMKTLTVGKHTVKLYDGLKVATGVIVIDANGSAVQSAATGDMGVALYAGLAISSLFGMSWVGKKKRGE